MSHAIDIYFNKNQYKCWHSYFFCDKIETVHYCHILERNIFFFSEQSLNDKILVVVLWLYDLGMDPQLFFSHRIQTFIAYGDSNMGS